MNAPRPKVLFVDDEVLVLESIAVQLRRRFEVRTATSGAAALALLDAGEVFEVIVSDMRMPAMDGAALLHHMRERAPDTTRILLTGYTDLGDAVRAINDGYIFRLLTKPCASAHLVQALDDAIEQRRLVTQDRDLLERKLNDLSSQLLHAERLATLGTMASGVAHELNNISTIFISALSELRESAAANEPPAADVLADLGRVATHLRTHAREVMHLGRPGPRQDVPQDLCELVRGTLSLLRNAGRTKHMQVDVSLPATPVTVIADRTRIEQILVNLVGNAADAVGALPHARRRIRVSVSAVDGRATLDVEDTGTGIAPEQLASIFEPYFTTKPPGKGTGLGLPVVRQIVEGYGGAIEVTSTVGEGARFRVTLPLPPALARCA